MHVANTLYPTPQMPLWDVPGCVGVTLHSSCVFNRYMPQHTYDALRLNLIDNGSGRCFYRHAYHVTPPGTLIAIQAEEPHGGYLESPSGSFVRLSMQITPAAFSAFMEESQRHVSTPYFPDLLLPTLTPSFRRLWIALAQSLSDLERQTLMHQFFQVLLPQMAAPQRALVRHEHKLAQRMRHYIEAHYAENVSLSDLQRLCNASRDHLLAVFRQAYGESPHRYLILLRLEHAKDLLRQHITPTEVAQLTGFTDQAHLTRHFRQRLGFTPGWYAQRVHPENVQAWEGQPCL